MRDGICGIYKITNKINNKIYINQYKDDKSNRLEGVI